MKHLTVLYPPPSLYDVKNNAIWAGGPGNLVKHRTLDKLDPAEWTVDTYTFGTPGFQVARLPRDTHIWALGEEWLHSLINDRAIHKHRGYRLTVLGRKLIATYKPIDCWLFKDDSDDEESNSAGDDSKDVGITRRSNFFFWSVADFNKLLRPIRPPREHQHHPWIDPAVAADWLDHLPQNAFLYLDIETRYNDHVLDCIGLGWIRTSGAIVAVAVPFYVGTALAAPARSINRFWRSLYNVFRRPDITVVGHNLAFDLGLLHHYYHLPIPRKLNDTMLFMHRQFPGVDKSLSHAISYYTDAERNHKGDYIVNTGRSNYDRLASYNCQDICWTAEVHLAQQRVAAEDPAVAASANIANLAQILCFNMEFTGILVDIRVAQRKKDQAALRLAWLKRIIAILTGNSDFNANSSQQCAAFFYGQLSYPVDETTETGAPKMDTKTLYQLALKQHNPLIPCIIAFREAQKEASMLEFVKYEKNKNNF